MIMHMLPKYFLFVLLLLLASCVNAQPGCTDPLALNYNANATEDDNSCMYQIATASPQWTLKLDERISETSGLIFWDGTLWTHNDDSDTRLYLLDPTTAEIVGEHVLTGVVNRDWEDLAQDDAFIYVGDFGNNRGSRDDLHILRVDKSTLKSGTPSIDTIWFTFSDQESLVSAGLNQTEFDCEAFIVSSDSVYLFSKQWLSGNTTQYVLPKHPGSHVAQRRETFNIQGQVTGATFLEEEGILVLCGYAGFVQPFLFVFRDYPDDHYFKGKGKRINLNIPLHQVEAVHTEDGKQFYLSNEHTEMNSYVNIAPSLHLFDLNAILEE